MKRLVATGLITGFLLAGSAQAETYIAIEGSRLSVDNNVSDDLEPSGLRFRLGARVSEFFDVEGHFGLTSDDDSPIFDELDATYFGGYLKGYIPVGERSALFGLAGYTRTELTQTVGGSEFSDARTGFSWGFGLETQLTERVDLTADYMQYLSDEGLFEDISAVNFGLKLYF